MPTRPKWRGRSCGVVEAELFGKRPFRVHVDPSQDGAEVVNTVADRMRREMYRNIDLEALLSPRLV